MQKLLFSILTLILLSIPRFVHTENQIAETRLHASGAAIWLMPSQTQTKADKLGQFAERPVGTANPTKPDITPMISKSPRSNQQRVVREAQFDVSIILGDENQCSRFFGGQQSREALDHLFDNFQLTSTRSVLGIRMSGATRVISNWNTGLTYRTFEKAELNLQGAFFSTKRFPDDPSVSRVGNFSPATPEARVLMILHELGHTILDSNGKWLLPDDGGNVILSRQNTETIEKACEHEIRNLRTHHHD